MAFDITDHRSGEKLELMRLEPLEMTDDAVLADITHYYGRLLARRTIRTDRPFLYQATVLAVRDRLMERWNDTQLALHRSKARRACYFSMEFLMGRLLRNALLNLDMEKACAAALESLGIDLEEVVEAEHDAGLGNGGLGRLAACFLDSCASLELPVMGYGIRYHYGMFHQRIEDGQQIEDPDHWLRDGFPWEIERSERARIVRFGGVVSASKDSDARSARTWEAAQEVRAVPYDVPIPGYHNDVVNTLRLWSSQATDAFNLEEFNAGSYTESVASKNSAENISMVLYPNTATESGHELRLMQQYFLVSASLQDALADAEAEFRPAPGQLAQVLADKFRFQLNDTHPALAVAELMRMLVDERDVGWAQAWQVVGQTMAYTNHTLLPEALETWPVPMMERLLPRIMEIIFAINADFMQAVAQRWPGDGERLQRMSLIEEGPTQRVRMAHLAMVGSFSVNGVAELHSKLLRQGLFRDFAELWPDKFNNKTNGVTQRRWLAACNPNLAELFTNQLGDGWVRDLDQLSGLRAVVDDPDFQQRWQVIRANNKKVLAQDIERRTGLVLDPAMLFDVQVKRIHEYKRQLLNLLHVIHLYDRIRRGDGNDLVPRAVIIGGKAAPGYVMAKQVIHCINRVAEVINADPLTEGRLRLVFYPDYNVSAMERICTAADLSEQISTAGKEASGTGNMKFMMNGAVTIGTLDGANVEILEAVGAENFFLFGNDVDQVRALRKNYDPQALIAEDEDFQRVLEWLQSDAMDATGSGAFDDVIRSFQSPRDAWMTAADFRSFVDAQADMERAFKDRQRWTRMSILNSAASGRFSTDRTMRAYNEDIWGLEPVARPER